MKMQPFRMNTTRINGRKENRVRLDKKTAKKQGQA
jgi:hypothetical protein